MFVAGFAAERGAAGGPAITDVRSFGYQLQRCSADRLQASPYDLLVVDAANDYRDWLPSEVAAMRDGPCGPRLVLAYLSIGEAENYRWYWRDLPRDLLGYRSRGWPGNVHVRFWDPRWQSVIFGTPTGHTESSLDRILDQGFDGVWLDRVDEFEVFGPRVIGGNGERPTAAIDMVAFVEGIARHAREVRGRPGFLVVPQNGTSIGAPEAHVWAADPEAAAADAEARWLAVIDGVGAEDTFFSGRRGGGDRFRPRADVIERLDRYRAAGKPVFAIDYVGTRRKVTRFRAACAAHGFVAFATRRALDRLGPGRYAPPLPGCDADAAK